MEEMQGNLLSSCKDLQVAKIDILQLQQEVRVQIILSFFGWPLYTMRYEENFRQYLWDRISVSHLLGLVSMCLKNAQFLLEVFTWSLVLCKTPVHIVPASICFGDAGMLPEMWTWRKGKGENQLEEEVWYAVQAAQWENKTTSNWGNSQGGKNGFHRIISKSLNFCRGLGAYGSSHGVLKELPTFIQNILVKNWIGSAHCLPLLGTVNRHEIFLCLSEADESPDCVKVVKFSVRRLYRRWKTKWKTGYRNRFKLMKRLFKTCEKHLKYRLS